MTTIRRKSVTILILDGGWRAGKWRAMNFEGRLVEACYLVKRRWWEDEIWVVRQDKAWRTLWLLVHELGHWLMDGWLRACGVNGMKICHAQSIWDRLWRTGR